MNAKLNFSQKMITECGLALLSVAAATFLMLAVGRNTLSETAVALLYLLPVGWVTARWGQLPGACAALMAALLFDFFFIPPFYTFTVGSLDGWMALAIFAIVAVVIIGRIQAGLSLAQRREREATFMFELTARLVNTHSQEEIARVLAEKLHELYRTTLVQVTIQTERSKPGLSVTVPEKAAAIGKPDRTIPIMAARDFLGDVHIWQGDVELPPVESHFLENFTSQAAFAVERLEKNGHSSNS
jgi:K+-sensing histidine kinase KdpD